MNNTPISGNTLKKAILSLLQQRLPPGWKADEKDLLAQNGPKPDYCIVKCSGPHGEQTRIVIAAKASLEPKDAAAMAEKLRAYAENLGPETIPLAAAPFLSLSTRQRLKELDMPYADPTGNVRIVASQPALFIETQGAQRNPYRQERPARSLKGAKAGRIVRALCDTMPPFAVRKLASAAGIDPGYVSRVLSLLETEDLIQREPRGPVTMVRWRKLIERWSRDYSFLGSNRVVSYLEPRVLSDLSPRLASAGQRAAITGSAAAAAVAPIAPTRLLAAYVDSPEEVARRLGLRPAESGANVLLAEPYDGVVFERMQQRGGTPFAALSQTAVDLLTGPGRSPSEAQVLLDWMEANESTWRR